MYSNVRFDDIEEISKAFPSRLIVMLYDEAIAALIAAIDAIAKGDIEARFNATNRTSEVIAELYLSLDMEQGGGIAEGLGGIYNFILTQLPKINFENDPDIAEQAIKLLRPVRQSWFELDERIHAEVESAEGLSRDVAATVVASDALATKDAA